MAQPFMPTLSREPSECDVALAGKLRRRAGTIRKALESNRGKALSDEWRGSVARGDPSTARAGSTIGAI